MRNLTLLLLPLCLFLFTACGDDDDSASAELTQENIVGDWNLTALDSDFAISIAGLGDNSGTSDIANSSVIVTFEADGTWTSDGQYDITIMSSDTTETETYDDGIGSGTYTVTSTMLTMTGIDSGDEADTETPTPFMVTNFQEGMLIELDGNVMETVTDPFFGLEISADVTTKMTLEK